MHKHKPQPWRIKMASPVNNNRPVAQGTIETGKIEYKNARSVFEKKEAASKAAADALLTQPINGRRTKAVQASVVAVTKPTPPPVPPRTAKPVADTLPPPPDLSKLPPPPPPRKLPPPPTMPLPPLPSDLPPPPPASDLPPPPASFGLPPPPASPAPIYVKTPAPEAPSKIGGAMAYLGTMATHAKESVLGIGSYFKKSAPAAEGVKGEEKGREAASEHSNASDETVEEAGIASKIGSAFKGVASIFNTDDVAE